MLSNLRRSGRRTVLIPSSTLSSPGSAFTEIANNRVSTGRYYAQSFSLTDKASSITDGLRKIKPGVEVESYHFWVNAPFYRYLNGEAQ
ncbi:UNVERIFIED_CONTAM: hypothetical protein ABIC26_003375 [Paenibacillus sp. PvR008]